MILIVQDCTIGSKYLDWCIPISLSLTEIVVLYVSLYNLNYPIVTGQQGAEVRRCSVVLLLLRSASARSECLTTSFETRQCICSSILAGSSVPSTVWNSIVLPHNYLPNIYTVATHYSVNGWSFRWNVHQVPTFARYILRVRTTRNRLQAGLDLGKSDLDFMVLKTRHNSTVHYLPGRVRNRVRSTPCIIVLQALLEHVTCAHSLFLSPERPSDQLIFETPRPAWYWKWQTTSHTQSRLEVGTPGARLSTMSRVVLIVLSNKISNNMLYLSTDELCS